ncbi:MAG: protoheme IX farnesyltransferase [Candidatus Kapabacteria bacterium]|nr:protoheme IX farnesyltransferase [Candidatus Kapabacteria bacterium]
MSLSSGNTEAVIETPAAEKVPSIAAMYYELTKPGISKMVMMTTLAGYHLALPSTTSLFSTSQAVHLAATMFGTLLISSGSCVVNHIMERDVDSRMKRTSKRPIPSGAISVRSASIFAAILSLSGAALLLTVNALTFWLAIATWLSYVMVYTPMKTRSSLAVIVGGVPGALPFMGGWTAVTGAADAMAWVLFAILFFWQLPHFYALSWMYRADYREGGMVLRAITDDTGKTLAVQMTLTSVLLLFSAVAPTLLGVTGNVYLTGVLALGGWLIVQSALFFRQPDAAMARKVLLTSYAVLMGIVVLMFLDKQ